MKPYRGPEASGGRGRVNPRRQAHNRGEIKRLMTILPNATINDIYSECSRHPYTHVHILAHGIAGSESGHEQGIGLGLADTGDRSRVKLVDGRSLANALRFRDPGNPERVSLPSMVTLASCDSGNVGSVITHGASIAHELHNAGVPFVIASSSRCRNPVRW